MIESEALRASGIRHAYFTRGGGHSTGIFASLNCGLGSGDDPELVVMNRNVAARALGVGEGQLVTAHQVHSADVMEVKAPWPFDARPKVDGLVTTTPGIAIGVLTADCGPVLFSDPHAKVIGCCHAGWKGALNGVTDSTVTAMERLGAKRQNMVAVLGPTIAHASYEVGLGFRDPFLAQDPGNETFFTGSINHGHFMFDLPAYIRKRLKAFGIGQVYDLGLDTYEDEARFYSYRRATHRGETDYGRLVSAIALA